MDETKLSEAPGWVRTDEWRDVLASIRHCAISLNDTEQSDGAWKWVVLSLHSALQGAMVCHLSGTAEMGALTEKCAKEWSDWHQRDGRGEIEWLERDEHLETKRREDHPPNDRIACAPVLFKRLGSESERVEHGGGQVIEITDRQRKAFDRLHELRNEFVHFSPKGWSVEIDFIQGAMPDMLDIIARIVEDSWSFRHVNDEQLKLLKDSVYDLRVRFLLRAKAHQGD